MTPNKKVLGAFYESIIDSIPADTIIDLIEPVTASENELVQEQSDEAPRETTKEELEIISDLYPNPAKDQITLNLSETGSFQ